MQNCEKNKIEKSTLYLVATPIGNLSDISQRAKKVLSDVDFIAAEDTRNSMKLLLALGIKKELVSYYEHNKKSSGERIIERLLAGDSCALITDAGMPAISDPGEDIVRLACDAGITVSTIPGPCAAVCALSLGALSTSRFSFEGFLSAKSGERKKRLCALKDEERTMIFYEAPHKLKTTLTDMKDIFGDDRRISLCREMTKLNEEVIRTTLNGAVTLYSEKEPRGEYVLVLEGMEEWAKRHPDALPQHSHVPPQEAVRLYMEEGMSKMDAIKTVAKERGVPKSQIYSLVVKE